MLCNSYRADQPKDEEFMQDAQVCVMEARKNLYTKGDEEEGMYIISIYSTPCQWGTKQLSIAIFFIVLGIIMVQ